MAYRAQPQPQPHGHAPPHYAAVTESRVKHLGSSASALASLPPATSSLHGRPFYLSAAGSRNKHHKGTFSAFEYEVVSPTAGPPRPRTVDLRGAPLQAHRGVTSLRARTLHTGSVGAGIPGGNRTLSLGKEWEWHPSPYVNGGQMVHEHPRNLFEGLDGVKAKSEKIAALHPRGWHFGPNLHHGLFDPTVRGISRDNSFDPDEAAKASIAYTSVPHHKPFLASGGVPVGVGSDRRFLGGHAQFPYHYSPYEVSEKSLTETKTASNVAPGFRKACEHAVHYPLRSPTARPSPLGGGTDRNPNFHAIQAAEQRCHHRCNEVLAQARAQPQQVAAGHMGTMGRPLDFTTRF